MLTDLPGEGVDREQGSITLERQAGLKGIGSKSRAMGVYSWMMGQANMCQRMQELLECKYMLDHQLAWGLLSGCIPTN